MTYKKKLIEVALPLDAINKASAREKSIRHGHPSTLHLWWSRKPLATARAVIFAQMVDDPSAHPDIFSTEKAQDKERKRLFRIIEELVKWENTTNETVLQQARDEIWASWRRTCAENADHSQAKELFNRYKLPAFHDPFAGGGALPLEAQRLGLEAYASDLNPVAVLINKAMIEIPPKFAGKPPVNTEWQKKSDEEKAMTTWKGAQGLAEDVRFYGKWMRDEAEKRIGHLYPKIEITKEMVQERPDLKKYLGQKLTVIAWLWVRTVKSPNPAFAQVDVPLVTKFWLSSKAGKEAYVEPVIENSSYHFTVKVGKPIDTEATTCGTAAAKMNAFRCLISGTPISFDYIRVEAKAGRMGERLMAIVADGQRERIYMSPTEEMETIACSVQPAWKPDVEFFQQALGFRLANYGMNMWSDLFTPRQLVALTTFYDLVQVVREHVKKEILDSALNDNNNSLAIRETHATAYADAIAMYLAMGVNRTLNSVCMLVKWNNDRGQSNVVFARQVLSMLWDYADVNPFAGAAGDLSLSCDGVAKGLVAVPATHSGGCVVQLDAAMQSMSINKVVSTDPPYYDNIGYADLSDFFYVWLRRAIGPIFPDLFSTLTVPKADELVATPGRHGGKQNAEIFFLSGMKHAMHRLAEQAHPAFPVSIYYAFKQSETNVDEGTSNTGWETFLDAVIHAGFAITGTWPMRTEREGRPRGFESNTLASSIVLVCRKRTNTAAIVTRRDFIAALKTELPEALVHLQRGNIAPVDLAQAAIGPGMAVYTRYAKVLDAEGKPLKVRDALALINQILDETLAEQEGDFDEDSRWALAWFEQFGFNEGEYGVAETLSKAKNTSVEGLVAAGFLKSKSGKVRILKPSELPDGWDPTTDKRLTVWEMVHHLIRVLESGGEPEAAKLVAKMGTKAETARELCYRLYTLCERKKRAAEALSYNSLVQSWPEISRLAADHSKAEEPQKPQSELFEND